MRQIEDAVEIRVDRLTASSELDERGLFVPVALLPLEPGDPTTDGLGTIRGSALGDLGVESRELAVVETDGDLGSHPASVPACQPIGMQGRPLSPVLVRAARGSLTDGQERHCTTMKHAARMCWHVSNMPR